MNIEIRDASLEARIVQQMRATGVESIEAALARLLDTQEEQDRWLHENQSEIGGKILRGIGELERGEGVPEHRVEARLALLKSQAE